MEFLVVLTAEEGEALCFYFLGQKFTRIEQVNSCNVDTPLYVRPEGNSCDVFFINSDAFIVYPAVFLNKRNGKHFQIYEVFTLQINPKLN